MLACFSKLPARNEDYHCASILLNVDFMNLFGVHIVVMAFFVHENIFNW